MPSIRVFEHQNLLIGDKSGRTTFTESHFQALARFARNHQQKYYTLLHRGVKFSHYVGAIRVGELTIEILPKADRSKSGDQNLWRGILLEMLQYCGLLRLESLSSARLRIRPHSILDLYFEIFLNEISALLRKGLARSYRLYTGRNPVLKGRIDFSKQLRMKTVEDTCFYIRYHEYGFDNLPNQILLSALQILEKLSFSMYMEQRVRKIKQYFSGVSKVTVNAYHFRLLETQRYNKHYKKVLEIARLLILNYSPDIRIGSFNLLAVLFDMNLLFEEYVFRQLKRLEGEALAVYRQQKKPFWQRQSIRPDILLKRKDTAYIIDTKWKILDKRTPSVNDLKQLYIYQKFFEATRGMLLYPKAGEMNDHPPAPFKSSEKENTHYFCQINFIEPIRSGKLNRELGKEILGLLENSRQ